MGREQELYELEASYLRMRHGEPVLQLVTGGVGLGKTELIRHFLRQLSESASPIVLHGRCYQKESVPFKAWDSIIDALSSFLRRLSKEQVRTLLPRYLPALTRLFPVLKRVKAIEQALEKKSSALPPDSIEVQRQAFIAFKDFLGRLAEVKPLVIFMDDLHWGDQDSAVLLEELLSPPMAPELLLIGSCREEERDRSCFFKRIDRPDSPLQSTKGLLSKIELKELPQPIALSLARQLLGENPGGAELIARESRGNPFLLRQLFRSFAIKPESLELGEVSLNEMILSRLKCLSQAARVLAETVALIGHPVPFKLALHAAGLESIEAKELTVLRAEQFISTRLEDADELIESPHDHINESVISSLSKDHRIQLHRQIAEVFAVESEADPEMLAFHFGQSGDAERSKDFLVCAAEQAFLSLAFDRAADLCKQALALGDFDNGETHSLNMRLGEALTNMGQGVAAAEVYLAAVPKATKAGRLDLRRRAAGQFFACGYYKRGREVVEQVAEETGITIPKYTKWDLIKLLFRRFLLWLKSDSFSESTTQGLEDDHHRVETCWAIALLMTTVDTFAFYDFVLRTQYHSMRTGNLRYFVLSLLSNVWFASVRGHFQRSHVLRRRALSYTLQIHDPRMDGWAKLCLALSDFNEGYWQSSLEWAKTAESIFRKHCTDLYWETGVAQRMQILNMNCLGNVLKAAQIASRVTKEARKRGDLYLEFMISHPAQISCYLAKDEVEKAEEEAALVNKRWAAASGSPGGLQEYYMHQSQIERLIYKGRGLESWEYTQSSWNRIKTAWGHKCLRFRMLDIRARSALAAAGESVGRARAQLIEEALRSSKEGSNPKFRVSCYLQSSIEAGAGSYSENKVEVVALLGYSEEGFQREGVKLRATLAKRCRALILGQEGQRLLNEAETWLAEHGISNPARMTALYFPGCWQ